MDWLNTLPPVLGGPQIAHNVAEQVALAWVLGLARANHDPAGLIEKELVVLPAHPEWDEDWDFYEECLFPDTDFGMLWEPQFDGIETCDDEWVKQAGIVNLHPSQWFNPLPWAD